ncbi:unnamed protein product [Rotaria socialis]
MTSSSNENIHQKIRNEFPYDVKKLTDISIPVDKNIKSTATIWMHQKLFGFPTVKLNLSSNTNYGLICVRFSMIDEKTFTFNSYFTWNP